MPRVPEKENFEVGVQPFSAHFNDTIHLQDNTRMYRDIADGLMIAARGIKQRQEENDRLEAQTRANQWGDYTAKQTVTYSDLQGRDAIKDADGNSVFHAMHNDATQYRTSLMKDLTPNQQKYFNLYAASSDRAFAVHTMDHYNKQFRTWANNETKLAMQQAGSEYLKTGDDAKLTEFAIAFQNHARNNGMDDKQSLQAMGIAGSSMISARVDYLLETKDIDGARRTLKALKDHMTGEDYLKASAKVEQFNRDDNAQSYGQAVGSGGGGGVIVNSFGDVAADLLHFESRNEEDKNGMPKVNKNINKKTGEETEDVGRWQINTKNWKNAAKAAGEEHDPVRIKRDAAYANKLGRAWAENLWFPEAKAAFGTDGLKIHASYVHGVPHIKDLVNKYGDNWRAHLPKSTQDRLTQIEVRTGNKNATPAQRDQMIADRFPNDPRSQQIARQSSALIANQQKEDTSRLGQENMAGILGNIADMAANGDIDLANINKIMDDKNLNDFDRNRVQTYINTLSRGESVKTNWTLFNDLQTNPSKLANTNLLAYMDQLAPQHLQELQQRQQEVRNDKALAKAKDYKGTMQSEALLKRASANNGYSWDSLTNEQKTNIRSYLYHREKEIMAQTGKFTKDNEMQLIKEAFKLVPVTESFFSGDPMWEGKSQFFAGLTPEQRWTYEMKQLGAINEQTAETVFNRYFKGPENAKRRAFIYEQLEKEGKAITQRNMVIKMFELDQQRNNAPFQDYMEQTVSAANSVTNG